MMKKVLSILVLSAACSATSIAADAWGLKQGSAKLKSADVLAFGPDDVLFVGDTRAASVLAIATGNTEGDASSAVINIENLPKAISHVLGRATTINDLVANPATGNLFVACTAGDQPAIIQINGAGKITEVSLEDVKFSSVMLANAPEDKVTGEGRRKKNDRADSITDLAFFEGKLLVSGLQSSGSPSSVREIDFPFAKSDKGIGIQIFHAAHGREEDYAAMRTFVPLMIDGEPNLLGAYVCTPLVKIPLKELSSEGEKVTATTVAELGNRNRPLDMVSYTKEGHDYLLLSNSARGVMKITTAGLSDNNGLTEKVSDKAGQSYETIEDLQGVVQMAKLNETHAVVLIDHGGQLNLKTVPLP